MRPHDILSIAVTAACCVVTANHAACLAALLLLCVAAFFAWLSWRAWSHAARHALPCAGRALSIGTSCGPRYWSAPECGNALSADASEDTLRLPAGEYVL